jgi:hypothetical protein
MAACLDKTLIAMRPDNRVTDGIGFSSRIIRIVRWLHITRELLHNNLTSRYLGCSVVSHPPLSVMRIKKKWAHRRFRSMSPHRLVTYGGREGPRRGRSAEGFAGSRATHFASVRSLRYPVALRRPARSLRPPSWRPARARQAVTLRTARLTAGRGGRSVVSHPSLSSIQKQSGVFVAFA